jgi:hypothetical protein
MSSIKFPEPITGILGPPGSGKTFLAGTLIPEFRAAVAAKKPHMPTVKINDVWWLQFDRAGVDTLRSYGVEPAFKDVSIPPTALVDLFANEPSSKVIGQLADKRLAWLRRVNSIVQELKTEAAAGTCRLVVVDSMTAFTRMVTDAFICEELIAGPSDKFNKQRAYGLANMAIGQIVNTLRSIPVAQIWLLHSRTSYTDNTAEMKDDEARRPIVHTLEIDVQRGVQGAVEPIPSMMLGAKVVSDQKGSVTHHLITKPDGVYPIKNRWAARMPTDTTPDLQRVWDVIAAVNIQATEEK